jgi:methionine aminotransferase
LKTLPSKLPGVGTTIFTVMSQLAAECGAINLSQGFPDFDAPAGLLDRVAFHLRSGHNQYAPMAGLPELRHAIAAKLSAVYGRSSDAETEITVTSGATEALYAAINAFVHPGDEVIVLDPAYDSYDPAIRLAGGRVVHVPLRSHDFSLDFDRLTAAIGEKTRMLVLNTPHNPTGAVVPARDMQRLAKIISDAELLLLSDEVYEHMVYDGGRHESVLRYPELAERSIAVFSFGKTYHATGWKIGYVVANLALTAEFRRVHQFVQFCVATPLQYALADFLDSTPEHYLALSDFYERKRDYFVDALQESRFTIRPSAGTYFQLADYSSISDAPDTEFARQLTVDHGVACIPISVFCEAPDDRQRLVRFCFAKDEGTLERAAEILCRI